MRFCAVLSASRAWLLLVYVPVAHWVWGGGWLAKLGVLDFAGGIVVHINAGVAALVAALVLGSRRGFPDAADAAAQPAADGARRRHAVGRLVRLQRRQRAGRERQRRHGDAGHAHGRGRRRVHLDAHGVGALRQASVLGIVTGMVAGLGTITPASGFVGPRRRASCIGVLAGIVCFGATQLLKRRLQIDDSLDVLPVHGVGGVHGHAADRRVRRMRRSAARASPEGMTIGEAAWRAGARRRARRRPGAACMTFVILKVLGSDDRPACDAEQENEGLDLASHGERGYTS